jgi:hypothetical protein
MKETKKQKYLDNLKRILISFNVNLENLLEFVRILTPILRMYEDRANKKREALKNILRGIPERVGIKEADAIGEDIIEETADEITDFLRAMSIASGTHKYQTELLYKTSFVMLISYFDYLLSDVIHCYYILFPDALSGRELSISLDELRQCYDREDAIGFILNKKVDSVLYGNLRSQMIYLEKDLKINISEQIINWDIINEAVERRNVIVHNNGVINRRYLNNVKISVKSERKVIKEGGVLTVDGDYFGKIYDEIMLAGLLLVQSCWRKWIKKDIDEADKSLVFITEKALIRENWRIAEKLGLFGKNINISSQERRNIMTLYYGESLKQQGRKEELKKELENINEEGLSPMVMAALCALKDDKDGFYKYVKKVAKMGKTRKEVFYDPYDWPVFNDFRKDKDYKDKVEKAFSSIKAVKNS